MADLRKKLRKLNRKRHSKKSRKSHKAFMQERNLTFKVKPLMGKALKASKTRKLIYYVRTADGNVLSRNVIVQINKLGQICEASYGYKRDHLVYNQIAGRPLPIALRILDATVDAPFSLTLF